MTTTAGANALTLLACSGCGTEVAAGLQSCPACHGLVHAVELRALAARAAVASAAGELAAELTAWRASLDLLPPQSRQFAAVSEKVSALSQAADASRFTAGPVPTSGRWKWLIGTLGPGALILWKLKFLLVVLLTKGKLLLLGFTKIGTISSMLVALGLYWSVWGLPFAIGFVLSIYIHEMGHVAALRHYGIRATAPMFIPGVGAFIALRQAPNSPRENARIGLAGPVWGLGAAVAAYLISLGGGGGLFLAIASTGAWINLFNLLPVWQLDGNRGFAALTRTHRWFAVLALVAAWRIAGDGMLVLLILVAVVKAFAKDAPTDSDRGALWQYAGVTLALAVVYRLTALNI
jgi:Zn-dependent protease